MVSLWGYLPSQVYKFTGPRRNRNIYATKGVTTGTICNAGTWQGDKKSGRAILHTANVDELKTLIFGRLKKVAEFGPGYCHFPESFASGSYSLETYFEMLTNEQKKEKKKAGRLVGYEWEKIKGHLGNEPLDCRAYGLAALRRLNPNLPKIKARLELQAEKIRLGLVNPEQQAVGRKSGRRVRSNGVA